MPAMDRLDMLDQMSVAPALSELPLSQLSRLAESGELCDFGPAALEAPDESWAKADPWGENL